MSAYTLTPERHCANGVSVGWKKGGWNVYWEGHRLTQNTALRLNCEKWRGTSETLSWRVPAYAAAESSP